MADYYNLTVNVLHTFAVGSGQVVVHNCGNEIPWSSKSVKDAAKELEHGATEVAVGNRSEAEELFLGKYQGEGYKNTTGMSPTEAKDFYGSKEGTYHWDTNMDPSGRLGGHGASNPHGDIPHLQIHPFGGGPNIRIFFP